MMDMDPGGVESGSSSVSPQDVGSKNEEKVDPAVENPVNLTSFTTEFPCHEPHPLNSATSVKSELEERDEPAACQLGELLSSNLETIFGNAIKNIVECGFDEDVAEKAISSHGPYLAGEDPVKNIVNDALNILKEAKENILTDQKFRDFQQLVEYKMLEMVNAVGEVKPFPSSSTLSEKKIVVPSCSTDSRLSLSLSFEKKSPSELEGTSSTSIPHDKRDDLIKDLVSKLHSLQLEYYSWDDWANRKVTEACDQLRELQPELKMLRQEKEKAKQSEREDAMKRLAEMEFALNDATNQVEMANSSAKRLEVEQTLLKEELEAAKLKEAESAARLQEAMKKERQAQKDVKSCEGEKILLEEKRQAQKQKLAALQRSLSRAIELRNQAEARLKHENKVTEDLRAQAASIKKQLEQLEAAAEAEELKIKRNAEKEKQKLEEVIERKRSELNMMLDSSKIKRECIMCMSAESRVVFVPCGHQVFCVECNKLHMQMTWYCPMCRRRINDRIEVKFAGSSKSKDS